MFSRPVLTARPWAGFFDRRTPRSQGRQPLAIAGRGIFILPTPAGFGLAGFILLLLATATNYGNSLVFLLAFALTGLGLVAMLEMSNKGVISIEKVIQKMCHAPADLFRIDRRGYIREGYFADLVLVAPNQSWEVSPHNILYKCGWSPFEGQEFSHQVISTFVNGQEVYKNGKVQDGLFGHRLNFLG